VRVLGAGRVEQLSNGGQKGNEGRAAREAPGVCEGARGTEGRAATEQRQESAKGPGEERTAQRREAQNFCLQLKQQNKKKAEA
jgi:hypothetical protein